VDGLSLGIRKDVTRIPVTPGNSFVGALSADPPVVLTPKDFQRVLVISALERDEPSSGLVQHAIAVMGLLSRAWAAGVEKQKCQYAAKSCHGAPRSAQACRHGV
jgi:hypothetical protein